MIQLTDEQIVNLWNARGFARVCLPDEGEAGQQVVQFARALLSEAVCAEFLAATAGASENGGTDETKQGDHLSEQPSVDRCVLTDDQVVGMARRFFDVQPELSRNLIRFVRAMQDATLAAVNQQASEPYRRGMTLRECMDAEDGGESIGVREALARLVALKDLKEFIDKPRWNATDAEIDQLNEARAEYERLKEPAWEAAREVLK